MSLLFIVRAHKGTESRTLTLDTDWRKSCSLWYRPSMLSAWFGPLGRHHLPLLSLNGLKICHALQKPRRGLFSSRAGL